VAVFDRKKKGGNLLCFMGLKFTLNLLKFILVNGAPQLFGKKHSLKYLPLCSAEKIVCVCVWI